MKIGKYLGYKLLCNDTFFMDCIYKYTGIDFDAEQTFSPNYENVVFRKIQEPIFLDFLHCHYMRQVDREVEDKIEDVMLFFDYDKDPDVVMNTYSIPNENR